MGRCVHVVRVAVAAGLLLAASGCSSSTDRVGVATTTGVSASVPAEGSGASAPSGTPAATGGTTPEPTTTPEVAPSAPWQNVLGEIGDDGVPSVTTALEAFTLVFGPLPAVRPPAAGAGAAPIDPTLVEGWVIAHWTELTAAQQDAAYAAMVPVEDRAAATPRSALKSDHLVRKPTDPTTVAMQQHLDSILAIASVHLGDLKAKVKLVVDKKNNPAAEAEALGIDSSGGFTGALATCDITAYPSLVAQPSEWDATFFHEVFHCYEFHWAGLARGYQITQRASWLMEGAATWAELRLIGREPSTTRRWVNWFGAPGRPLQQLVNKTGEAYDDVGFFGKLSDEGVDLFTALPTTFAGASDTKSAFDSLVDPIRENFASDWGVSYLRKSDRGPNWDISGPDVPSAGETPAHQSPIDVPAGGSSAIAAPPFSANVAKVTSGADLIEISLTGYGRVGDDAGNDIQITGGSLVLCLLDKCECPAGSTGEVPPNMPIQAPFDIGFSGADSALTGMLVGHTLDDYCNKQPPTKNKFCDDLQHLADIENRDAAAIAAGTVNPGSAEFLQRAITDRSGVFHDMTVDAPADIAPPVDRYAAGYAQYAAVFAAAGYHVGQASRADADAAVEALAGVTRADLPSILAYAKDQCNVIIPTSG